MASSTSGASIHYTLNGTMPTTSSPLYTVPVSLSSSAVVTAKAFLNSESSYENSASYTITSTPTAQFLTPTDSGPSGSYYPLIALSAIPTGPVKVSYTVTNGTPASGTYTFIPGITYGILPLTTGTSGTMTVTLSSVTGAASGANRTLQYTVTNSTAPADFSLAISPATQSVAAGSSASYNITVTPLNGFTGTVSFKASGLPSGATGTFSPASVTGSGSVTLTVATTTAATLGTSTVSVTGTSGSLSHASSGTLGIQGVPNYSLSVSPSSQTVTAGGSASYTVTVTSVNGFNAAVNLGVSGLPAGVTGSLSSSSITGSQTSTLTIKTTTGAAPGNSTVSLTGTSGSLSQNTSVTLSIQGAPSYSLSVSPSSQTVAAGSSASYTVTVAPVNGFNAAVNLGVSGLPAGATGSFSSSSITASGTSTLTIKTTAGATLGNSTVSITGTSGSLSQSTSAALSIQAAPSYSLSVSPSSQTVAAGGSASYTVTVAPANGFNAVVNLGVSGLPAGATGSFSSSSIAASGTSTLTIKTTAGATLGNSTVSITGTSGSLSQSTSAALSIQAAPDYSLSVSPSSQTVLAGGSVSYSITVAPLNDFSSAVTFGVSGLPTGVNGTFSSPSVTGSGSTTLTITTTAGIAAGSSTLSIIGVSGSLNHSGTATLSVQAAPDYAVVLSPSSQTVAAGGSVSYTVTVMPVNGFNSAVNFGVSGLPSGVTGSFSPASVTGSGSTTLMINTTSGATPGGATVNVMGTSGSLSHAGSGSLMINGSGPTAVSVSPSSGTGASQVFAFQFADPKGYANLSLMWFGFSSSTFAQHGCKVQYAPRAKTLYLEDDSGAYSLGPLTPGVAGTVSNSQCTLNAGASSVSGSGNNLTVNVALSFQTSFAGVQQAYMYAIDLLGLQTAAWQDRGTWIVP